MLDTWSSDVVTLCQLLLGSAAQKSTTTQCIKASMMIPQTIQIRTCQTFPLIMVSLETLGNSGPGQKIVGSGELHG